MNSNITASSSSRATSTASKKYPLVVLIHGGPQSAFNDSWGYPLESADLRECRLRRVHAEPARLDRLRTEVRR
jgi:hypothetical protein